MPVAAGPRGSVRGSSAIVHDRKSSEKDLVQLVYVSSAAPALGADDLDAIAARSATNNAALGITGFLMHNGAYFYGVLEGRRRHVFTRMEEIITDRRHSTLRIIREEASPRAVSRTGPSARFPCRRRPRTTRKVPRISSGA